MLALLQRQYRRILASLLLFLLAFLHLTGVWTLPFLHTLDNAWHDLRVRLTAPHSLDERIVIIDVDERSLAQVGQWPWSRDKIAALVQELTQRQQVAALGLDTIFAEPQRNDGLELLQRLASGDLQHDKPFTTWLHANAATLDADQRLAETLSQGPVALAYYLTSDRDAHRSGQLPRPLAVVEQAPEGMLQWNGYGAAIAPLVKAAPSAGFINSLTSADGVVRAAPLLTYFEGGLYESLALATLRQSQPGALAQITRMQPHENAPLKALHLSGQALPKPVPMSADGTVLIPYRGPGGPHGGSFPYISAADVLGGKLPPASLQGRVALLGFTAPGLMDLRTTPVGHVYPGVEVHANIISGMLDGRVPLRPGWEKAYQLIGIVCMGLVLTLVLPLLRAGAATALSLLMIAALVGFNIALYVQAGLALSLATGLTLILTTLGANLLLGYLFESRVRRELAQQFATYIPPELVQQMLRNPERYDMRARAEELTVMFCDLRGFTTLAESMEPLELQKLLNQVLNALSEIIRAHHGTIDKYIGDCVMAFWGAPLPEPAHARRAITAALSMIEAMRELNAQRVAAGLPEVRAGIGLNTGVMSVGNMGSSVRRTYTVIGDAVNLGARLESLTRDYDVDLVASEYTRAQVTDLPDGHYWQELDRVRVKGRRRPVTIYTLRTLSAGQDAAALQAELAQWDTLLAAWRHNDFERCADLIAQLRARAPNYQPYRIYEKRIATCLPYASPTDWDESSTGFGATKLES